jgi:PKD repeat protein
MRVQHRWRYLAASATAAIALGSLGVSTVSAASSSSAGSQGASAHSQHPASIVPLLGKTPFDQVFTNMDYNGGPLMPSNTDYMVLWSPSGLGAYPAGYVSGLKQWFRDLAHDSGGTQNTDSVSAQYADLTGAFSKYAVTFGGALVDTDPYPTTECPVNSPVVACLTDPQIQQELVNFAVATHHKADLSHEYFLLTPPEVESCFTNDPSTGFGGCSAGIVPFNGLAAYCAYHQNTSTRQFLIYANDPFVPGNPHCDDGNHPNGIADGELSGGLSHEQNESVTDPIPNDAWTNGAGAEHGEEVGDQCDGQMGTPLGTAPDGAKFNQVINGHLYWYQEEWSNIGHTCLQRLTLPATMPRATFTVNQGNGLTLKFDASGSTASPGFILYVWQFNDAFGAETIEQSVPRISHTFPSAGAYSVGLTVFGVDGSSAGTGGLVTTGHSGFTPGFSFSPAHPSTGQTIHFSGLTTVSAQPVINYLWEFGDGTTGSGPSPHHVYAAPGTYTITQVMFSGTGSAFPGEGAGPIDTQTITVT